MGKISKDTPLAEITLRKYEKPQNVEKRELVRKFCLSIGILQPGDSRDIIVDVLQVLFENKAGLSPKELEKCVIENRKKYKLALLGIAPSNIRRQLLRLKDLFLIEKNNSSYKLRENLPLIEIFNESIESYYLNSIISRVKDYVKELDKAF